MTEYRCKDCGWQGSKIIKWEERPRDEFWVKCPNCHHVDECIEVFRNGVWVQAIAEYEPTPEEIERSKRFLENLSKLMTPSNVFLETEYRRKEE